MAAVEPAFDGTSIDSENDSNGPSTNHVNADFIFPFSHDDGKVFTRENGEKIQTELDTTLEGKTYHVLSHGIYC